MEPADFVIQIQIADLAWIFKPVYAWISDNYPIWGYRRKSYVIIASFLAGLSWFLMGTTLSNLSLLLFIWALENLFICFADVVVDALMIERVKREECDDETKKGVLQTLCSTLRSMGKCSGCILGALAMAEHVHVRTILILTGLGPTLISLGFFGITEYKDVEFQLHDTKDEEEVKIPLKVKPKESAWQYIKRLLESFAYSGVWKYCLVAVLYSMSPEPSAGYLYYYQDVLHIQGEHLQLLFLASQFGGFAGNFFLAVVARKWKTLHVMIGANLGIVTFILVHATVILLLPVDVRFKIVYLYLHEFATSCMDIFLYMPLLIESARLTQKGMEGTSYALILSIQNLGAFIDSLLAALLMYLLGITRNHMQPLWYMSFACAYMFMIPLAISQFISKSANKND